MTNRLSRESSPYLRQHAHNPVDWYPWGDEALNLAEESGKPILLSIGYSSCHWCHVMERESFDDPAVAEIMNQGFVNVKVDREERPDVDSLYMRALQSMGGRGGWPLTVFLTPDGKPFYGGTYFPPEPRHGMPSFRQVLGGVLRAWREGPEEVRAHADRLGEALRGSMLPPHLRGEGPGGSGTDGGGDLPSAGGIVRGHPGGLSGAIRSSAEILAGSIDREFGGMGPAPKFPQPLVLDFLLHQEVGVDLVTLTLDRMARGGIRDHLGGGFHRYSVDGRWLVPHFEKMLYDNALLLGTYRDAYLATGEAFFRDVCLEIGEYLLEDLWESDPEAVTDTGADAGGTGRGGFMAARDADSEGEEGLFYVWTAEEIEAVLGPERAGAFMRLYGVTPGGNFEGRNILHLPVGGADREEETSATLEEEAAGLAEDRARLLEARSHREEPFLDRKVLTGWNGLAVRTMARSGVALDRPHWVEAAAGAARFILDRHRPEGEKGTLARYSMAGEPRGEGVLEDWASLGLACLALHEATLEPRWFDEAVALAEGIPERFLDPESGLLFDAPRSREDLVVRPRDTTDTPIPSGTSLAVELLLRMGRLLEREEWVDLAERTIDAEAPGMARFPAGYGRMLANADLAVHPPEVVVLSGDPSDPDMRALLQAASRSAHPRATLLAGGMDGVPESRDKPALDGAPTAYVCRDFTCLPPVTDAGELAAILPRRE